MYFNLEHEEYVFSGVKKMEFFYCFSLEISNFLPMSPTYRTRRCKCTTCRIFLIILLQYIWYILHIQNRSRAIVSGCNIVFTGVDREKCQKKKYYVRRIVFLFCLLFSVVQWCIFDQQSHDFFN